MASVTKHIVVRLEMTVPEARVLRNTLMIHDGNHPTDPIYRALRASLAGLEEEQG